mgnify:CR=1 FL=1
MSQFAARWWENIRFAFNAMRAQKLRSFLTLIGVMAGVATVIMMVSFVVGFDRRIAEGFASFGTNLIQFQKFESRFTGGPPPEEERNRPNLTLADAEALKRFSRYAAAVSPERYYNAAAKAGSRETNDVTVVGTNADFAVANERYVNDGRFLSDADVRKHARGCLIGTDLVDALFPLQDPIDREVLVAGRAYRVVGVFEKKGSAFGGSNDNYLAIPISAFDEQFPEVKYRSGEVLYISTVPRSTAVYDALIEEGTAILRARRGLRPGQPNDFAVTTTVGQLKSFRQITSGVAAAMLVIAGIALVVGGVGVMNIMLVNVTQRTREIGLRKALGATRRDVAQQFLMEAVTLTGFGGALGIAFGLGAAFLVRFALDFQAAAPLWSILLGFGVSTAVGLLFGIWPALKAAGQDPIEALRYE